MLSHFQVAFADLIASPELIAWVRAEPEILRTRYDITDVEWRRLVSVIEQPGMQSVGDGGVRNLVQYPNRRVRRRK